MAVRRPRAPGAYPCGVCRAIVDRDRLRHISAYFPHRKRGWVCDACMLERDRYGAVPDPEPAA